MYFDKFNSWTRNVIFIIGNITKPSRFNNKQRVST